MPGRLRVVALALLLSSFVLIASAKTNRNASPAIVEGSGSPPSTFGKNAASPDTDWEASGNSPDDEDGDVVEGSGTATGVRAPEVEGSGLPPQPPHNIAVHNGERVAPPAAVPIATTVITITTEEAPKQLRPSEDFIKPDSSRELTFPVNENDDDGDLGGVDADNGDEDEDDEDDEEEEERAGVTKQDVTTVHTTPSTSTTTNAVTKRPVVVVGTEPPRVRDSAADDLFPQMLKPGILAAVTGGAIVGILLAILLVIFIIYRIRKKDEGSYSVDEGSHQTPHYSYAYQKAATKEFYA